MTSSLSSAVQADSASDPTASANTASTATPSANALWTSDERRFKVFISYSRGDSAAFAGRLLTGLEARGLAARLDTRDLEFGLKWQAQLKDFIRQADAIVYVVSPRSVSSKWCRWELAQVVAQSKRLVPVVHIPVAPELLPVEIGEVHLFAATPDVESEERTDILASGLKKDSVWLQEHTRLTELAYTWTTQNKSRDHLLRGAALRNAEAWVSRRPQDAPAPSQGHLKFIAASQVAAKRRARGWMIGLSGFTAIAIGLAGLAWMQRSEAIDQRNAALLAQSRYLTNVGSEKLRADDPVTAALIALEALPDDAMGFERPVLSEARTLLTDARQQQREVMAVDNAGGYAVSPDGMRLLTGGDDHAGHVYSLADRKEIAVLPGHGGKVRVVAFSRDGTRMVTGADDGSVILWDARTHQPVKTLAGHAQQVTRIVFSAKSDRLVTSSVDCTARVWNAISGEHIRTFDESEVETSGCASIAASISADGEQVLSVGSGVRLWNVATGTPTQEFQLAKGAVKTGDFSPVSDLMALTVKTPEPTGPQPFSFDRDYKPPPTPSPVVVYSSRTRKIVRELSGHLDQVTSAAFSPDGSRIISASNDGTMRVWDVKSGASLTVIPLAQPVRSAAFAGDNDHAVTEADDGTVSVWDIGQRKLATGLRQGQIALDGRARVGPSAGGSVAMWDIVPDEKRDLLSDELGELLFRTASDDGTALLMASTDGTYRVWRSSGIVTLGAAKGSIAGASFTASGDKLATQAVDGTIRLWDAHSGALLHEVDAREGSQVVKREDQMLGEGGRVTSSDISLAPSAATLIEGVNEHNYRLWNIKTAAVIARNATTARFSQNGDFAVTTAADNRVSVWDARSGAATANFETKQDRLDAIAINNDGTRIATVYGIVVMLWNSDGSEVARHEFKSDSIATVHFSPDGKRLILCASDDRCVYWRTADGREGCRLGNTHDGGEPFSPDGRRILLHAFRQLNVLFEADTCREIATLPDRDKSIASATFSPDSKRFWITSDDGLAYLWDSETGESVATLGKSNGRMSISFMDQGEWVAALTSSGHVRRLHTPIDPIKAARAALPRCLAPEERKGVSLSEEPPDWCITGADARSDPADWQPKWPYERKEWKEWLIAKRSGKPISPPRPRDEVDYSYSDGP